MRLYHDFYLINPYFCSQELLLLMNAYFQICVIFATRVYKSLIDISR